MILRMTQIGFLSLMGFSAATSSYADDPDVILKVPVRIEGDRERVILGIWVQCYLSRFVDGVQQTITKSYQVADPRRLFIPTHTDGKHEAEFDFTFPDSFQINSPDAGYRHVNWSCTVFQGAGEPYQEFVRTGPNGPEPVKPATYGTCYRVSGSFSLPDFIPSPAVSQRCV